MNDASRLNLSSQRPDLSKSGTSEGVGITGGQTNRSDTQFEDEACHKKEENGNKPTILDARSDADRFRAHALFSSAPPFMSNSQMIPRTGPYHTGLWAGSMCLTWAHPSPKAKLIRQWTSAQ